MFFKHSITATLALLLVACGSSSPHGATDSGPSDEDAADDAGDDASDAAVANDGGDLDVLGPYPSEDAPQYGPDGCALITVTCTDDTMCCSGLCMQGVCASPVHPADVPR